MPIAELTLLGALWLAVLAVTFLMPLRYMAGFMLFSAAFQAAAVVNAGGKGVMPLLVAEMAFILRWLAGARPLRRAGALAFPQKALWAVVFCGYACVATAMLPLLFHGATLAPVAYGGLQYPPQPVTVALGGDHALTIFSLFLHGTVLLIFTCTRGIFTARQLMLCVKITVWATVCVGLWETAAKAGLPLPFPEGFFYNNAGYTLKGLSGLRTNFTFAEPSYAGGFYAALLVAFLAAGIPRCGGTLALLLAAFVLSLAGTSAVTLAAGLVILAFLPGARRGWLRVLLVLAVLMLVLLGSGYLQLYYQLVAGKLASFSGRERLAGLIFGWRVFARSGGLGVGMGTARTFSFASELLSSLGVLGAVLYTGLLGGLLRPLYRRCRRDGVARFALVFALAHLAAQCAALPDITTPTLWMSLFVAACADNLRQQAPAPAPAPLPFWRAPQGKGATP